MSWVLTISGHNDKPVDEFIEDAREVAAGIDLDGTSDIVFTDTNGPHRFFPTPVEGSEEKPS